MATGAKTQPTRVMDRSDVADVELFLKQLDELLVDIPVYVDYASITISKAGMAGAEDELGTVTIETDDQEKITVKFKPYGS